MTPKPVRRWRGFTLVELMVALAMGLIVGTTVVALSKEVTNTFHEEARIITAESGVRTAMDRLRADIARASMMSTPSAVADPAFTMAVTGGLAMPYLVQMAGIRVIPGGSTTTAGYLVAPSFPASEPAISTVNGLAPDAIEITGNFSPNADYYSVQHYYGTGGSCGGPHIVISNTDAAYRVGSIDGGPGVDADKAFRSIFVPVAGNGNTYFARIQDRNSTGIPLPQQYVLVCDAGYALGNLYVDLAPSSAATIVGLGEGSIINPIATVRWRITTSPNAGPYANVPMNPGNDPLKFDLIRTFLNSVGNEVGGADNPFGEVVAEYMVDMKFAGSVDTTPGGNTDAGPNIATLPFDDGGIEKWAGAVTATRPAPTSPVTTVPPGTSSPAPQRVRSLSIRLSSRAANADRTVAIYPDPVNPTQPYMYRYALGTDGGKFARVRTLMSEVVLMNQGNAVYP